MVSNHRARILLADDHSLVAAGISKLLEADFDLIGTVGDGRALVAAVEDDPPDVVLLDISMPVLNGLEAACQIHKSHPNVKLIFVTVHSDNAYVIEALRAGASGYVLKRSAASELPAAIHEVLNGNPGQRSGVAADSGSVEEESDAEDRGPGTHGQRGRRCLQPDSV